MLHTPNLVHALRGSIQAFLTPKNLVRLELAPVLKGLTWNWTFAYSSNYLLETSNWINSWIFWEFLFDLNFHLDIMVWLENGHLHISANTCATALKLCKHLGGINARIFCEFFFWFDLNLIFLVRLELVHVLNGLTLNWTFTYSRTIYALGLVFIRFIYNYR